MNFKETTDCLEYYYKNEYLSLLSLDKKRACYHSARTQRIGIISRSKYLSDSFELSDFLY